MGGESSIDFESTKGDGVRIANYRYPVQVGVERKGILFYVHGYGCNVHNHAYLAEMFARAGYEFCGMDQRGFGKSEGVRGRIESADLCLADAMKFNEAYYEKYGTAGGKRAPCFLLGNSLGGLLAACMAAENHMDYASVCLTVPYFAMKDKQLLERLRPVAQVEFGEWEYRNKYLDHKAYQWPTGESSIDFESTKGDGVRIANYRYPVQ